METRLAIPYSGEWQEERVLDLFLPEAADGRALLLIHGGGWSAGSRAGWHSVAQHFCERGLVCASADYRLTTVPHFPHEVVDVRLAMSFFRAHAEAWGFDPSRVAAMGSSAGGHLVAMLATIVPGDPLGLSPEMTVADTRPNAAVCYCPVLDLHDGGREGSPLFESTLAFIGGTEAERPDLYCQASPPDRITGDEPPFLIVHGDIDPTVPLATSRAMAERLRAAGVAGELVVLPGAHHGFGYGVATEFQKAAIRHVERFFEAHLG